jgi:glucose-6-phosphate 1-epimerase
LSFNTWAGLDEQAVGDAMKSVEAINLNQRAFGAQILTADTGAMRSVFYLTGLPLNDKKPARGGVPVLFPQFADTGPLQKHGFARDCAWTLMSDEADGNTKRTVMGLSIKEGDFADWPHRAELRLTSTLTESTMSIDLEVSNAGADPFAWTGGLHPYFKVEAWEKAGLTGLDGVALRDRYDASRAREAKARVTWGHGEVEVLYDTSNELVLHNGARKLLLTMRGFDQWMLWNPGERGMMGIKDAPLDAWAEFVCVEPVLVDRPCRLGPNESFVGGIDIRLVSE